MVGGATSRQAVNLSWRRRGSRLPMLITPGAYLTWRGPRVCFGAMTVRQFALCVRSVCATEDAKCWPIAHPYGSGSVLSESGSGNLRNHIKNRCTLIQSWFRKTSLWAFWYSF